MRFTSLLAIYTTILLRNVEAAPFDFDTVDLISGSDPNLRRQNCEPDVLSNVTWVKQDLDGFLANASQKYTQYSYNNVQALAAYLGAPNFFCGINSWCNAGQPCSPVGLPGWYVLMGMQGWNNYVNNLDSAVLYTTSILGLKFPKIVDDLWPKKKDNVTPLKMGMAWINGILNGFPTTALIGKGAGMVGSNIQAFNIIAGGMMFPPSAGDQYLHWSEIASQMGSLVDEYKQAIAAYAKNVIDAPIADPQWGINKALRGGAFLSRNTNLTQDDVDNWMYQSVSINAIGLILQAQNIYIIRTFNRTDCVENNNGYLCEQQPNGVWTEWRLHKKDSDDWVTEYKTADKLLQSYNFTKQTLFKGPSECFDSNDYQQLTNPWETVSDKGVNMDPWLLCNFNVNVCNFDITEDNKDRGEVLRYIPWHTDRMCERQGIVWS
ncbi:hypothetical protein LX36DRAFT_598399 [Colletotrichum falcatum]|nr:hypothetical protein LX36DRAFT_598399 [Colletotrichum falcatum]